MIGQKLEPALRGLLRYFLGLTFVATGIGKLLDNRGFSEVIATYQLGIPEFLLLPLALVFSLTELYIGLNLVRGRYLTQSALATLYFHIGYAALGTITMLRGIALTNCGCFGVFLARPLRVVSVVEDLVLAAVSISAWWLLRRVKSDQDR